MLHPPQEVMLARTVTRLPPASSLAGGCLYEPKWDGYRALLFRTDTGTLVQSRRGSDITAAFPDIVGAAEAQLPPGSVLDGELVIWSEKGLDFSALQRRVAAPARVAALASRQRTARRSGGQHTSATLLRTQGLEVEAPLAYVEQLTLGV